MRPNECAGSPLTAKQPRDTCYSGTALILTHRGAACCSHSRSVPLFWEQVVFVWVENVLVSLKAGPLPLLWGTRVSAMWCGCVFGRSSRRI